MWRPGETENLPSRYSVTPGSCTGSWKARFETIRRREQLYLLAVVQPLTNRNSASTKGSRLGYMGHLTLIAEDVITALEHFPPELRLLIIQYAPEEEWDRYVTGRYLETKANDTRLLGGGKPVVASRNISQWKVDEDEMSSDGAGGSSASRSGAMKSEFRRVQSGSELPRNTAHFLPTSIEEEEEDEDDDSTRAAHVRQFSFPQLVTLMTGGNPCYPPLVRALPGARDALVCRSVQFLGRRRRRR
jgi:hypothetical protein